MVDRIVSLIVANYQGLSSQEHAIFPFQAWVLAIFVMRNWRCIVPVFQVTIKMLSNIDLQQNTACKIRVTTIIQTRLFYDIHLVSKRYTCVS
jgi:hypothetical protein